MASRRQRGFLPALLLLALLCAVPLGDASSASARSSHGFLQRIRGLLRDQHLQQASEHDTMLTTAGWMFPLEEWIAATFYWPHASQFELTKPLGTGANGKAFAASPPEELAEFLPQKVVVKLMGAYQLFHSPKQVPLEFLYQVNAFEALARLSDTTTDPLPDPSSIVFPYAYFVSPVELDKVAGNNVPDSPSPTFPVQEFRRAKPKPAMYTFGMATEFCTGGELTDLVGMSRHAEPNAIPNAAGLKEFAKALGDRDPIKALMTVAYSLINAIAVLNLSRPPIVHRDIKPENIFLQEVDGPNGIRKVPKLGDFGNAVFATPAEGNRFYSGETTPIFTPPEAYIAALGHAFPFFSDSGIGAYIPWRSTQYPHSNAFDMWQIGMTLFNILLRLPKLNDYNSLMFGFNLCYSDEDMTRAEKEFQKLQSMQVNHEEEPNSSEKAKKLRKELIEELSLPQDLAEEVGRISDNDIIKLFEVANTDESEERTFAEKLEHLLGLLHTLQASPSTLRGTNERPLAWKTFLGERQAILKAFFPVTERREVDISRPVLTSRHSMSHIKPKLKPLVSQSSQVEIIDRQELIVIEKQSKKLEKKHKEKVDRRLVLFKKSKKKGDKKSKKKEHSEEAPVPRERGGHHVTIGEEVTIIPQPRELDRPVLPTFAHDRNLHAMHTDPDQVDAVLELLEGLVKCHPLDRLTPNAALVKVINIFVANKWELPGGEGYMDPGLEDYTSKMHAFADSMSKRQSKESQDSSSSSQDLGGLKGLASGIDLQNLLKELGQFEI